MVDSGRYVYCIIEPPTRKGFGKAGLMGRPAHVVEFKEIGAVVSPIPYKEVEASIDNIIAHQAVVDLARKSATTLPVKFGVIFRTEDGVKTLLNSAYAEYKEKLAKFKDLDEYGVKILFKKEGMGKLKEDTARKSKEVARLQKRIAKAGEGKSYFLKMKMDEALRTEAYKNLDRLSHQVHDELARGTVANSILKSEHEQIILNAAYLVKREEGDAFVERAKRLGEEFAHLGLIVHSSGPWAPYSFC